MTLKQSIKKLWSDEQYPIVSTDIDKFELLDILSTERRYKVVKIIAEQDNEVTLNELATHLSSVEIGKDEDLVAADEKKARYVTLYQHHLPKLKENNIVDWDKRENVIDKGEDFDAIVQIISWIDEITDE